MNELKSRRTFNLINEGLVTLSNPDSFSETLPDQGFFLRNPPRPGAHFQILPDQGFFLRNPPRSGILSAPPDYGQYPPHLPITSLISENLPDRGKTL